MSDVKGKTGAVLRETAVLTGAVAIIAAGVFFFLVPSHTSVSSISGLGIVLSNFVPLPLSVITMILNVVLLIIGFFTCGREFGAKTVYTSVLLPVFLGLFEKLFPEFGSMTGSQELDVLCYILVVSIGLSILFNRNASSGGLDIVAKIMNKYLHMELGKAMSLSGMCVALSAPLVYDKKTVVLSILGTYFNGIVLDHFIFDNSIKRRVCIITEKEEALRQFILHDLHSGATMYEAIGAYNLEKHNEIITIVDKSEYQKLMNFINREDPKAFVTIYNVSEGTFALMEKPKPVLQHERDAIVKVTLASICSSDLHIKHGSVPRAVPGITVGHEMVGIVEEVGSAVTNVKPGDRVTVNVETFCGECFFCKKGFVNNCTNQNGGWALGCRIDGGQAEYVRVPFADQGLNKIPDGVTDRQALLVGDVLATGFWAARISEITPEDTVLILGAGPTGICTLLCVMLHSPKRIIVCEKDASRLQFIRQHYPQVLTVKPEDCATFVRAHSDHGGADVVLEVAGADSTFRLAWECARPNAIVTVVALYDKAQTLPLPEMYGKNLTFKTGGVDGCDCEETLRLIAEGKIDTEPLITHTYPLRRIAEGYELFEKKRDGVIKVAVEC